MERTGHERLQIFIEPRLRVLIALKKEDHESLRHFQCLNAPTFLDPLHRHRHRHYHTFDIFAHLLPKHSNLQIVVIVVPSATSARTPL
jgi:hypothetical protein